VSGSGISWAICKSAPRSRQITMPAHHHSVFYRPDALPATQPVASKHWGHNQYLELYSRLLHSALLDYFQSVLSNKYQLSLIDPCDGIVLWTELDS